MPIYWNTDREELHSLNPNTVSSIPNNTLIRRNYYYSIGSDNSTSSESNNTHISNSDNKSNTTTMEGIDVETVASAGSQQGPDQPISGSPAIDPNQHTTAANHVTMETSQSTILHANSSSSSGGNSLFASIFNTAMETNPEADVATGSEILIVDEDGDTYKMTLSQYMDYLCAIQRGIHRKSGLDHDTLGVFWDNGIEIWQDIHKGMDWYDLPGFDPFDDNVNPATRMYFQLVDDEGLILRIATSGVVKETPEGRRAFFQAYAMGGLTTVMGVLALQTMGPLRQYRYKAMPEPKKFVRVTTN